jgi:hypothetical protein
LCYSIPLACIVLYYSCGSVVHDCSSTVKTLHSVRRDSIRPIHGPWGPSATLQPLLFSRNLSREASYFFAEWRLSSTRLRLISCLSIRRICEGRPHSDTFCGVHTDCSICVIFGKTGSLTFDLGGLVSKLGSTYTPPSQHLSRYALQLPSSPTKSIVQLQA